MAGLKLSTCFWYLDPLVTDDVLATLKKGKFDVHHSHCKEREQVKKRLLEDPPDLIISDFDLPDQRPVSPDGQRKADHDNQKDDHKGQEETRTNRRPNGKRSDGEYFGHG